MNFIIPSSTYRYVKFCSYFSGQAKKILEQLSGVEPSLFLLPPLVGTPNLELKPWWVKRFLKKISSGRWPLTNGRHGVRLHGFTEFGFKANRVNYARNLSGGAGSLPDGWRGAWGGAFGLALLKEQIILAKKLATVGKVNDNLYPSVLTIHLGRSFSKREVELEQIIEILNTVSPVAKVNRVIVNLETTWSENLAEPELGADLDNLAAIFSQLKDPANFGITFDVAHSLINYHSDYDKLKNILMEKKILPLINYIHLTAPHRDYQKRFTSAAGKHKFFFAQALAEMLSYQPDSHAGLATFFHDRPEEKDKFLDLVDFLVKKSKVAEDRFNVINLEMGLKVWGTDKGAKVGDLAYTLDKVRDRLLLLL